MASRPGPMAEWLRRGLQILARRFDSGSGLHSPVLRVSAETGLRNRIARLDGSDARDLHANSGTWPSVRSWLEVHPHVRAVRVRGVGKNVGQVVFLYTSAQRRHRTRLRLQVWPSHARSEIAG